jgi:hypothetical protein
LRANSGSVISARFIPQASTRPVAIQRSALRGSTIRVVAISGGPTRYASTHSTIASSGVGGGGTMPTQPRNVDESPIATWT